MGLDAPPLEIPAAGRSQWTAAGNFMKKNLILFVVGCSMLTIGITLVLRDWIYVVMFVRGTIGMALGVAGLVVLMLIKDTKDEKKQSKRSRPTV